MKETVLNSEKPLSSQQPRKVVFIEMFRAGPQISSNGQKMVFTESDLDSVVGSYDPSHHEAPLIIGHDQDDGTASLGWVQKIWRKGKELWGKVELTPKAEQLIRDGVFKKVSSSFYLPDAETNPTPGKLSLRHLGLVPIPAVKGLAAFSEISEDQTITIAPTTKESCISFKEPLGHKSTMARKKSQAQPPTTVEHGEGGMTVNINIGGSGKTDGGVYDDTGSKISETGAPADYDMDYGLDEDEDAEGTNLPSDGEGEEDFPPADPEGEADPSAGDSEEFPPSGEEDETDDVEGEKPEPTDDGTEDISDDVEGSDEKIAQLASDYEIEELIKALALKTDAASMMESDGMSSYSEGSKKEPSEGEEEEDEESDESKKPEFCDETDMSEEVKDGEKPAEAEELKGEVTTHSEEESDKSDEEEDDEAKKAKAKEATGSLDHSEKAMRDHGQDNLQARVAELEEELAKQRRLMREKELSDFAEVIYSEARLTEQIVPKTDLVRFMETLNCKNSVNFSETGKASQFDFFKQIVSNLPSMVSFEELATPASAPAAKKQPKAQAVDGYVPNPDTLALHTQALEYSEEKGVEYTVALKAVMSTLQGAN